MPCLSRKRIGTMSVRSGCACRCCDGYVWHSIEAGMHLQSQVRDRGDPGGKIPQGVVICSRTERDRIVQGTAFQRPMGPPRADEAPVETRPQVMRPCTARSRSALEDQTTWVRHLQRPICGSCHPRRLEIVLTASPSITGFTTHHRCIENLQSVCMFSIRKHRM